jgi:hypothetical protein
MIGQVAKKPSLMVVPSRSWCFQNGFLEDFNGEKIPDYRRAFDETPELNLIVAKIGQLMSERGFDLKLMSNALASLAEEKAEDMAMVSDETGADIQESNIDKLRKVAKADIWMEVDWLLNNMGFSRSVTFNLSGIDAYSNMQIANCQGTGSPSYSSELPILLSEAVSANLDNFNEQLMSKFEDWFENGRQITVEIKVFSDSEYNLESEVNGDELGYLIEDWMGENTVKSQFSTDVATSTMMKFSNVRIPMVLDTGKAMDARAFGRELQKMLKAKEIRAKATTVGLGRLIIIIGSK